MINTSPEPLSNWTASLGEDGITLAVLALALTHPWWALVLAVLATSLLFAVVLWVFRQLLRQIRGGRKSLRRIGPAAKPDNLAPKSGA